MRFAVDDGICGRLQTKELIVDINSVHRHRRSSRDSSSRKETTETGAANSDVKPRSHYCTDVVLVKVWMECTLREDGPQQGTPDLEAAAQIPLPDDEDYFQTSSNTDYTLKIL
ncbi:UNVERIFIED_CONTAM: hypothetical protein PYX00_008173 [Menopon gallinae]|uniref:Uncharacterized protein n=1 Tax=Menopon gallinae TaxID=328185 RepID=A0AAW2HM85_9NEOP